jgi:non-homologous end joining protein Ku
MSDQIREQLEYFIQLRDQVVDPQTRARAQDMIDQLSATLPPGLGDRLEAALKATGIHQAVKAVERLTGKDCGCAKRKRRLNELGERLAAALRGEPDPPAPPPD